MNLLKVFTIYKRHQLNVEKQLSVLTTSVELIFWKLTRNLKIFNYFFNIKKKFFINK